MFAFLNLVVVIVVIMNLVVVVVIRMGYVFSFFTKTQKNRIFCVFFFVFCVFVSGKKIYSGISRPGTPGLNVYER